VSAIHPLLQEEFTRALGEFLARGEEPALLSAYELGRKALGEGLGVLDVATLLHEALADACQRAPDAAPRMAQEAGPFILECLSSFEMAHRAAREANTALRRMNDLLEDQTRRISHELHDQAGQILASVYLAVDEIAAGLPPAVAQRLGKVRDLLDRIEDQLRRLSHELRPTILDDLGLVAALEFLAEGVSARHGFEIAVDGRRDVRFPPAVETVLYRIMQEGLNNVARHAQASHVVICVRGSDKQVRCTIRDDGVGFAAAAGGDGTKGIGLIGIRERLSPLGGTFRISSAPGAGTDLTVTVPLEREGEYTPVILRPELGPSPD